MSSRKAAPPRRVIHEARGTVDPLPRYTPLLLLPASGEAFYVALNPSTTRVIIHWDVDERNVVWCDESRYCRGCAYGWRKRLAYYLPVCVMPSRRQYLLTIPSQAYHYSQTLSKAEGNLRGRVLSGGRIKEGKRAPGKVEVTTRTVEEQMLPVGWDALTDLARRWNLLPPGDANEGALS